MITEQDIIFDNLYEDIAEQLDAIMDEVIWDLADEMGVNHSMMMKIVEEWSKGVSDRLPLTVEVCEASNKILKEWHEETRKMLEEENKQWFIFLYIFWNLVKVKKLIRKEDMNCIFCKKNPTRVYASAVKHGKSIRYRYCVSCKKKFKTEEVSVKHKVLKP